MPDTRTPPTAPPPPVKGHPPPASTAAIPGYDQMNYEQKRLAQDKAAASKQKR